MREIPLNLNAQHLNDDVFSFEKIYEKLESLKGDFSDNPHIVQMIGEDHGYIIETYFFADPERHKYFWVRSVELFEMAIELTREISLIQCKQCDWKRKVEIFVAQQFLKKLRLNNIPNIISSATLDKPILPKNKITEFLQYELARHMRDNHAIHGGTNVPESKQENEEISLP